MMDELLLLSGNDIPFLEAGLTIHQPRLKEIAYITEQNFWHGCEILKFNKEFLLNQDKLDLSNISNFTLEAQQAKIKVLSILALLFPTSQLLLGQEAIQIRNHQTKEVGEINNENFEAFKQILISMFCLSSKENKQYNPNGDLARKIANKIMRGREQKAKLAPENNKVAIFSRYVSILAVGQQKDINTLMNYTVYQLMDEYNRYQLKLNYDAWERFKVAGATGMSDPEDWFKDIHDEK